MRRERKRTHGIRFRPPLGPKRAAGACALLIILGTALNAKTLHVPRDHPTIKLAMYAAAAGDVILVGPGVYLETNIIVDKPVLIKSEELFGAVVYGSRAAGEAIFVVRAAARIEGFVLKGGAAGIEQRGSPDVEWQAADLAIYGCCVGISVNDANTNIGRARVRDVVIFGAGDGTRDDVGLSTNDAGGIDAARCLFVGCRPALQGYDHLSFQVRASTMIDCDVARTENTAWRPYSPASSRIEMGADVFELSLTALSDPEKRRQVLSFVESRMFGPSETRAPSDQQALAALAGSIEGGILLRLGEFEEAERAWRETGVAARLARSAELEWQALRGLALASKGRGAFEEAAGYYERAIDLVERWLPDVPQGIYRINFLEDKMIAFEEIIGLLLDRHVQHPEAGHVEEAFFYAERAKNLPLLRTSVPGKPGSKSDEAAGPDGPVLAAKKRELWSWIATLQIELQDPDLPGERKDKLCSLLERAEEELNGLSIRRAAMAREEGKGKESDGKGAPGERARPLRFSEMTERLEGRAVISYFLGDERSYAFLVSYEGLEAVGLPAAPEINSKVEPYLRFLKLRDTPKEFVGARAGQLLFDLLLGPFPKERLAGLRKVTLCPDGRLYHLPFAALITEEKKTAGARGRPRFWGESVEIGYAPSATAAALQKTAGQRLGGDRVLAVADEGRPRCDNRSRTAKHFFLPLAHVKAEVRKLAGRFARGAVRTLIEEEAGEWRLKSMRLADFDIIHLAAHGVLDDRHWWRSSLILGRDEGHPEDGFFSALEVADLEIKARLVVLSACQTGLGTLSQGEGIRGLAGGFFQAGAETVLVSLWNVDDEATAAFMGHFYRSLAAGDPPSEALRKTRIKMIGSKYRAPFFWAPFVLIGGAGAS